jgi:hypothetical protein
MGLPPGEGFRLHRLDEAPSLGPFPRAAIAAFGRAGADPPALAGNAVACADDQDGQLRLASITQRERIFGREK